MGGHKCSNERSWNGSGGHWNVKTAIFKGNIETRTLRAIMIKAADGVIFGPSAHQ